MAGRYTLTTHTHFCAAHELRGVEGACAGLHGHNYKVTVEVVAERLDARGMGIDFEEIQAAADAAVKDLDHGLLNERAAFAQTNPTAENVAALLYGRLADALDREGARVSAVTVQETERYAVRYAPEG